MAKKVIIELEAKTTKFDKNVKSINKELKNTQKELKNTSNDSSELTGQLDKFSGGAVSAFKSVIGSLKNVTKGFKTVKLAVASTGIGLLIIAIASLTAAFRGSEEGQNKFAKIMTVIGALTGNLVDLLADLGEGIINAFNNPIETIKGFAKTITTYVTKKIEGVIDGVGLFGKAIKKVFSGDFSGALDDATKGFSKLAAASPFGIIKDGIDAATKSVKGFIEEQKKELNQAAKVADMRAKADKIERKLIVDRSKLESEVANLRLKSRQEEQFSAAERKQALLDAQKLEEQILSKETEYLELRRDAQILENTFSRSNKENLTKEAEAIAAVNRQVAARANTARQVQREVNTIQKQIEAEDKRIAQETKAKNDKIKADEKTRLDAIQKVRDEFTAKQKEKEAQSELEKIDLEEQKKIAELDKLKATENQKKEIYKYYAGLRTDVEVKENKKKDQIEKLRKQQTLNDAKSTLNQIAQLAGKDSKIGKAMAIASATISGVEGVQNAYSTAQKSPITTFFPAYPIVQSALAGAVALKNISAIKSVDPKGGGSSTIPTPSGGGGSVSQPPAFNVVGASDTNQLADAIGGQSQEPVRAFVVSNDVTTAQSMDRNIVDGASI